jgi:tRNA U34 2-thiouridine synthase MnmA/TrmU
MLAQPEKIKAVGLLSGGLDSTLAAKVVSDLGVEVHAVYFAMPWGCCNKTKALEVAETIGIKLIVLQLDERYLEIVRTPKHGYGSAMNPCVDCRTHMFSRARQYMESIGGEFVFTGEVLGQRPMSQMRRSMRTIEQESGLEGRLLRPLCAQLLDPTIPEKEGRIDREKLLAFSGRSRREQMEMAEGFGITDYLPPAGGCLLTDKNFARRMKDTLQYGYRNFRETIALKWGRHFRLSENFKAVLGRDENENLSLVAYAHPDDHILELPDRGGPTLILKGLNPDEHTLGIAAGLIQRYSRFRENTPMDVECRPANDTATIRRIRAVLLPEDKIRQFQV